MLGAVGMPELVIIAFVCLLIFGPRQLPKLGKMAGETIRAMRGVREELEGLHEDVNKK